MTPTKEKDLYSDEELSSIIERAASYSYPVRELTKDEVYDIGRALGLSENAMSRAIESSRIGDITPKTRILAVPGLFLASAKPVGFSGPIRWRAGLTLIVWALFGVSAARSLPSEGWIALAGLSAFMGIHLFQLFRLATCRYALIGVPNLVAGAKWGAFHSRFWKKPLRPGIVIQTKAQKDPDGGYQFRPTHELVVSDPDGASEVLFTGNDPKFIESVLRLYNDWRANEESVCASTPNPSPGTL